MRRSFVAIVLFMSSVVCLAGKKVSGAAKHKLPFGMAIKHKIYHDHEFSVGHLDKCFIFENTTKKDLYVMFANQTKDFSSRKFPKTINTTIPFDPSTYILNPGEKATLIAPKKYLLKAGETTAIIPMEQKYKGKSWTSKGSGVVGLHTQGNAFSLGGKTFKPVPQSTNVVYTKISGEITYVMWSLIIPVISSSKFTVVPTREVCFLDKSKKENFEASRDKWATWFLFKGLEKLLLTSGGSTVDVKPYKHKIKSDTGEVEYQNNKIKFYTGNLTIQFKDGSFKIDGCDVVVDALSH